MGRDGCKDIVEKIPYETDGTTFLGLFLDLGIFSILLIDLAINGATTRASVTQFTLNPVCEKDEFMGGNQSEPKNENKNQWKL